MPSSVFRCMSVFKVYFGVYTDRWSVLKHRKNCHRQLTVTVSDSGTGGGAVAQTQQPAASLALAWVLGPWDSAVSD